MAAVAACMVAVTVGARAQGLHTTAIRLELAPARPISAFEIVNPGARGTLVHARPVAWQQQGGEDQLTPTDRLVVNPPIFELGPGERQLVRIGIVGPATGAVEQAFRLLIDEVPDRVAPVSGQVNMTVRLSLPVFVAPSAALAPRVAVGRPGPAGLPLHNQGNVHVRIDTISLRDRTGSELAARKVFLYLLPGSEAVVPIPLAPGREATLASVVLGTDAGPLSSELR